MIDVSKLTEVHQLHIAMIAKGTGYSPPSSAWVDRPNGWVVQIWDNATPGCDRTPWDGTLRVSVKHSRAKTPENYFKRGYSLPITWDDLQAIKDHFWSGRIGLEIYPPHDSIVDVADMRWLWVLPAGACLPFNLQGGSVDLLQSYQEAKEPA